MADNGLKLVEGGLLSIDEAWAFLSISRAQLYNIMEAGKLPYVKLGKRRMIPRNAVLELARGGLVTREPVTAAS